MVRFAILGFFLVSMSAQAFTVDSRPGLSPVGKNASVQERDCLQGKTELERAEAIAKMNEGDALQCFGVNWVNGIHAPDEELNIAEMTQQIVARDVTIRIDVSIQSRRMRVTTAGHMNDRFWYVSPARPPHKTLRGEYPVLRGNMQRMHYSSLYGNSPMPYSIFYKGNYAIHGTGDRAHIGSPASHGCVRLLVENAAELFSLVSRTYGAEHAWIHIY